MQARFSIFTAFALGAALVLAAGRAGLLPPRVVPSVEAPVAAALREAPCQPTPVPPSAAASLPPVVPSAPDPVTSRITVCESSHGSPWLTTLALGPAARPAFAVHCGYDVEVVALTVDSELLRIAELTTRAPGPDVVALGAPVLARDVSGDGEPDLLVPVRFDDATGAPRTGALYELVADGHGSFGAPALLGAQPAVAVAAGRLLGAETTDVAIVGLQDPRQNLPSDVLLVRGGVAPMRAGRLKLGVGAQDAVAIDLDLDARDELLIVGGTPDAQVVYFDEKGQERTRTAWSVAGASRLVTADLDGDGHADAVITGDAVSWVAASREPGAPRTIPDSAQLRSLQPVDLDANGKLDLVGLSAQDVVALVQGDASSFKRRVLCSLPTGMVSPLAFAVVSQPSGKELQLLVLATAVEVPTRVELAVTHCGLGRVAPWDARAQPAHSAPLSLHYELR